jgi:8-oxo-dGTP pyrophosphatase MutT (NUDIX family)
MNRDVLEQTLTTTKECVDRLKEKFRIFQVDTSNGTGRNGPKKTAEAVADIVLNLIEEQLAENILHVDKESVISLFKKRSILTGDEGAAILAKFAGGRFSPREQVESDATAVQALPVVVVRNKSGEILRLRRKERVETSSLHQKLVIWAGGHVRQEDASNGDAIRLAAQRELQEELRLSVEIEELNFLGAYLFTVADAFRKGFPLDTRPTLVSPQPDKGRLTADAPIPCVSVEGTAMAAVAPAVWRRASQTQGCAEAGARSQACGSGVAEVCAGHSSRPLAPENPRLSDCPRTSCG